MLVLDEFPRLEKFQLVQVTNIIIQMQWHHDIPKIRTRCTAAHLPLMSIPVKELIKYALFSNPENPIASFPEVHE